MPTTTTSIPEIDGGAVVGVETKKNKLGGGNDNKEICFSSLAAILCVAETNNPLRRVYSYMFPRVCVCEGKKF